MARNLPPRERDIELLVADLWQAATDLWRELQEAKAAVPTAADCRAVSGEAMYELGVAVLRARRAERAAAIARDESESSRREADACRAEADDLRERLPDEADLVAYWSGVQAAVRAAVAPRFLGEDAADILARVERAMGSDPSDPSPDGDRA